MAFANSPTTCFLKSSATTHGGVKVALCKKPATYSLSRTTTGTGPFLSWKLVTSSSSSSSCHAIFRPRTEDYFDVIQDNSPAIKWHEIVEDATEKDTHKGLVESIRAMLNSMEDGEISISPYDTAWVALVKDVGGGGTPEFPSSLDWISNNQLSDGSWGDNAIFSAHDRILNTLACVIALRSWNMRPDKSDKGISFIRDNIYKLEDENEEHMPIGFEVALPSLIEIAKKLNIDIPYDSPCLQEIYARRELKLTKIPRDIMHKVPTTLLHSLEGMPGLEWQKLLNLQSADGSFLFSPSSTAFALQQTKDQKCLQYLAKHVQKFNGGVPNVYPVDLFEHIWVVDRLQRLGISRYFQREIDECIAYVHRYWTSKGICWARCSEVQDIDDTAMGFRLLRSHGYNVSADVFKHFESGGEFVCFAGQSNQAVTGMYNLLRASQVKFPGEEILENATKFSAKFLQQKRANNQLLDKWIITKDLPGEVGYALDVPWYASLPRIETRFYLEQYGGEDDVWIGKTLYRMPFVNNNKYLELAKLDYNNCQTLHQQEWKSIQKWYGNCNLGEFGLSERSLLVAYHIAAASVFEPEKSEERLAWAKTAILMETIESAFEQRQLSKEQKRAFVDEFQQGSIPDYPNRARYKTNSLVAILLRTLNQLSLDAALVHGRDIHQQLHNAWQNWVRKLEEGGQGDAELLVRTLNLSGVGCSDNLWISEELILSHPKYQQLLKIVTRLGHQLRLFQLRKGVQETNGVMSDMEGMITSVEIESDIQEVVKLVLTKSEEDDLDSSTKQNFLVVAKSLYYAAYCNPGTIDFHISKVLFERVVL